MGRPSPEGNLDLRSPDAPHLQRRRRRLGHQREPRIQHPGTPREDGLQPVLRVRPLLPLVEHEGRLEAALLPRHSSEQRQHHGVPGLHVRGAPAVDPVPLDPDLDAALGLGHRVQMASEHDLRSEGSGSARRTARLLEMRSISQPGEAEILASRSSHNSFSAPVTLDARGRTADLRGALRSCEFR